MRYIPFIVIMIFFLSCDCAVNSKGIVIDSDTRTPIDSAEVRSIMVYKSGKEELDATFYSDSNGNFYASGLTNHDGLGKCANVKLEIIKDNFISQRIDAVGLNDDTIFMVRQ